MNTKTFSLEEVAKHNSEKDCWMVVDGKVYDATSFIGQHPGGKAILGGCGRDATQLFKERPNTVKRPHPNMAKIQLDQLYIGNIK